jgi:hypothetical protein
MLRETAKPHFTATCVSCNGTAEFCPRRSDTLIDGRWRAIAAFKKVGWVCAPPRDHGMRQREYERAMANGEGEWMCPACVRISRARQPNTSRAPRRT